MAFYEVLRGLCFNLIKEKLTMDHWDIRTFVWISNHDPMLMAIRDIEDQFFTGFYGDIPV